ncbi:hypothetical protein [Carnobacterium maltaromaticum]|uniref:hypothetical protein n=1 Tax=Carnobacterium maltaromaticum TaxID=2751 RepID=UPI0039AF46DC
MIRGKDAKKIVYSNSRLSKDYQHIIYLLSTTSQSETAKFAKEMYRGEELEGILHFIKDDTNDGPFSMLLKHIMEKYAARICITKGTKKLFLSDNPVIVQKFEGEDYILIH